MRMGTANYQLLETTEIGLALIGLIGILILSYGIAAVGDVVKGGRQIKAKVQESTHYEKRGKDGELIQYYWKLKIKGKDHSVPFQAEINVTRDYKPGETIPVVRQHSVYKEYSPGHGTLWSGILVTLAGAGMLAFAIVYHFLGEKTASWFLLGTFLCAAAALFITYFRHRRATRATSPIEGTITDVLFFATERNPRKQFLRSPDTFYPVISYTDESGNERRMLSRYSSNSEKTYKKGEKISLYRDEETGQITDKKASPASLVFGLVLLALFFIGLFSNAG